MPDPIDESPDLAIYLSLLALTAATVGSAFFDFGRLMAISVAIAVAAMKASLIGLYFMELRREGLWVWTAVLSGLGAVAILLIGLLPDGALFR